ncbi:hypothetical protein BHM03_00041103 [Ensete ventricosum]|nr:hypothetical protein BHM03_00041103 [Ensete ventricosum]
MAYFCFDFRCASDAPVVGLPTVVSEPSRAWPRPRPAPLQGWPAVAKASLQRGDRLRPSPPLKGAVVCGQLAGATASDAPTRDGCPRRRRLQGWLPLGRTTVDGQVQRRRLHRAAWERGGDSGTHDAVAGDYDTS